MPKAIVTCGKICCGKSTYARALKEKLNAVILSIDELTLALFPEGAGEMHDTCVLRAEQYLLHLSLQILRAGTDVILDWGLWTREQRDRIRRFYQEQGIPCEIRYLKISSEEWQRRILHRNAQKQKDSYYVDDGLIRKVEASFQEPSADEPDIIVVGEPFPQTDERHAGSPP